MVDGSAKQDRWGQSHHWHWYHRFHRFHLVKIIVYVVIIVLIVIIAPILRIPKGSVIEGTGLMFSLELGCGASTQSSVF